MVLLDYHMPCANGLDVLNRIKSVAPGLPVLILTIEQQPAIAEELLLAGADDFINKPLRLADFLSRIKLHQKLHSRRKNQEKGISREKLQRVLAFMKQKGSPVEINEVSAECGIAYTTAHRYLDYLARNGLVIADELPRQGKMGRPTHSYVFRGILPLDAPPA
jgi:two-component system, CitB family, response regulator DctR